MSSGCVCRGLGKQVRDVPGLSQQRPPWRKVRKGPGKSQDLYKEVPGRPRCRVRRKTKVRGNSWNGRLPG